MEQAVPVQPAAPAPPPPAAPTAPAAAPAAPEAPGTALTAQPVQTISPAKPGEAPAATAPVAVDAKWAPKVIEGSKRDPAVVGKTVELFTKLGFNSEQAQALFDYSDELGKAGLEAQEKASAEAAKQQHADWWKSLQASKELGGKAFEQNKGVWTKAAAALLSPAELKQIEQDGMSNYPPLIHALFRAGSKIGEDVLHDGNRGAPPIPDELSKVKAQYPNSPELWDPTHKDFQGARR